MEGALFYQERPVLICSPSQTWLLVCRDVRLKRGCPLHRVGMGVAGRSSEAKVQH